MGALEYIVNASIIGLVKTMFPLWINMCIDDRFSIGSYIMPLTTSAPSEKRTTVSDETHLNE